MVWQWLLYVLCTRKTSTPRPSSCSVRNYHRQRKWARRAHLILSEVSRNFAGLGRWNQQLIECIDRPKNWSWVPSIYIGCFTTTCNSRSDTLPGFPRCLHSCAHTHTGTHIHIVRNKINWRKKEREEGSRGLMKLKKISGRLWGVSRLRAALLWGRRKMQGTGVCFKYWERPPAKSQEGIMASVSYPHETEFGQQLGLA